MGADGVNLQELARHAAMGAEKEAIQHALERFRWNRRKTAEYLQVSYKTLLNKMKECGISESPTALERARLILCTRRRSPGAGSPDPAASTGARGTRRPGLSRDPRTRVRRQRNRRDALPFRQAAQPPQQPVAVIVRQADVADQHVGRPFAGDAQAFRRGAGRLRLAAVQLQDRRHRRRGIRVVFGDQHVEVIEVRLGLDGELAAAAAPCASGKTP